MFVPVFAMKSPPIIIDFFIERPYSVKYALKHVRQVLFEPFSPQDLR